MNVEPTLSQHEFETFTRMLEDNVGLYLGKEKEYLIRSRLMPIAKQYAFSGYIIGTETDSKPFESNALAIIRSTFNE